MSDAPPLNAQEMQFGPAVVDDKTWVEFYKTQWTDINSIWSQSWEMAKIVLVVVGFSVTAAQAFSKTPSFGMYVLGAGAILASIAFLAQTALRWRFAEKLELIKAAEAALKLKPHIVAAVPRFGKSKRRFVSTGTFLATLHALMAAAATIGALLYAGHSALAAGVVALAVVAALLAAAWGIKWWEQKEAAKARKQLAENDREAESESSDHEDS